MDKIYLKDNYIVTELGGATTVFPIYYSSYSENATGFYINSSFPVNNPRTIFVDFTRVTSIYNEAGTVAYSVATLRSFLLTNTGFKSPSGGSGGVWGSITGTLSDQTDLQSALNAKQDTLISATNIKTINGNTLLGSGDLVISPSSTITVGTTLVTSGTDGRVFFQSGGVVQQDAGLFWDNTNKRLGVGGTPSTFTLDVNGTTRLQGSTSINPQALTGSDSTSALSISQTWNTTGTPTAFNLNITDTTSNAASILMALQLNGSTLYRFRKDSIFSFGPSLIASIRTTLNGAFDMRSQATGTSNDFVFQNGALGSRNHTSGNTAALFTNIGYNPTSGNGGFSVFNYGGIINQTGGANGTTRGIYITPVLTSAADWRSIEWNNNTGKGIWATGTAENAISGNLNIGSATSPQARLDIRAQGALSTDIILRTRNSADTRNFLVVNGAGDVYNNGAGGVQSSTFFGENSGRSATGIQNTFIGFESGRLNQGGFRNTASGALTLWSNITANENTCFGYASLNLSTSSSNSAFGVRSLFTLTTGSSNSAFGLNSLQNNATGSNNVAFGNNAGNSINGGANLTTVNNSVFIGFDTRANANSETNQIVIGHNAIGTGSNSVTLGNTSITRTNLRGQVVISGFASAPTGVEGAIYYDSTTKKHYGFDGTNWNALY